MRIAVLRALGLGDLLTAVPALRGLRGAYPEARLVLGTPAALHPLLDLVGAGVEPVDVGPFTATPPPAPPAGTLPAEMTGADLAVNLHGAGPQSTALLRATGPKRLVAYALDAQWRAEEHEVLRWCRLLAAAGVPADPTDLALRPPAVPSPAPRALVLHPGAAAPDRRWPARRWSAVARRLAAHPVAGGHPVVVTGSPAERELAEAVAADAGLPPEAVLAGRTPPAALAAVVAAAALLVSGDTGVAHLASAYRTPSVLLFGPVPPHRWGPPRRAEHRVLWAGPGAASIGPAPAGQPSPALLAISVDDVVAAALEQLTRTPGADPATPVLA